MSEHSEFDRASQIRRTMAMIRRDLNEGVEQVEESARTLMNWRYYTTHYPWACVGVAAAIGYFVVPRKLEIHSPDPKTLAKLARDRHLVVEQKPKAEAKGGLAGAAFSFVSGLVLKTAMAQLGHQLASIMEPKSESQDSTGVPQSRRPANGPKTAAPPRTG